MDISLKDKCDRMPIWSGVRYEWLLFGVIFLVYY